MKEPREVLVNIKKSSKKMVELERTEPELKIKAVMGLDDELQTCVDSGSDFVNELLKKLAEHAGMCMAISVEKTGEPDLLKPMAEVVGICLRSLVDKNPKMKKVSGSMSSSGEASSTVSMKFSKNPFNPMQIKILGQQWKSPKDFFNDDLFIFFSGLSHGLEAEMDITIVKSKNKQHTLESVSKATAGCFKDILKTG
jgi:imidazoleglycerol phosphate dehydratase HisB